MPALRKFEQATILPSAEWSGISASAAVSYDLDLRLEKDSGDIIGWSAVCGCETCNLLTEIEHGTITVTLGGVERAFEPDTNWLNDASTSADVPDANLYKAWVEKIPNDDGDCLVSVYIVFGVHLHPGEPNGEGEYPESGYGPLGLKVTSAGVGQMVIGDSAANAGSWPGSGAAVGDMDRTEDVIGGAAGDYDGTGIGFDGDDGSSTLSAGTVVRSYPVDSHPVPTLTDYGI